MVIAITVLACVAVVLLILLLRRAAERTVRELTGHTPLEATAIGDVLSDVLDDEDKLCSACKHFELRAAQEAMHRNPAFTRVMSVLSPRDNGRRMKYREDPCPDCATRPTNEGCTTCSGQRVVVTPVAEYPSNIPAHARWEEFGWCTNAFVDRGGRDHTESILWGGSANCGGKLFEIRRKTPELRAIS